MRTACSPPPAMCPCRMRACPHALAFVHALKRTAGPAHPPVRAIMYGGGTMIHRTTTRTRTAGILHRPCCAQLRHISYRRAPRRRRQSAVPLMTHYNTASMHTSYTDCRQHTVSLGHLSVPMLHETIVHIESRAELTHWSHRSGRYHYTAPPCRYTSLGDELYQATPRSRARDG